MKTFLLLSILGIAFLYSVQGQETLTVNTWAYFDSFVGGDNPTPCRAAADVIHGGPTQNPCKNFGFSTPPTSQGRWGTAAQSSVSGLGFQGVNGVNVKVDTDFFLGQLTHFNWPIYGPATSINLNIILYVTSSTGQVITSSTYPFQMIIDETPNSGQVANCPYPSTIVCSDKISFQSSFIFNNEFVLNGIAYTLSLQGFKESNVSGSSPVSYFISNEQQASQAFLFARFTAACPQSCENGGVVGDVDGKCVCNCPTGVCPSPTTPTTNCSCVCPPKTCLNGGTVNPVNCGCQCNTCPAPKTVVNSDCSCSCPTSSCSAGVLNASTCGCDCSSLQPCAVAGQTRDSKCACGCHLNCVLPKVQSPLASKCECVCKNTTCPSSYYTNDPNTCACTCNRQCHNSQVTSNCTCGPCTAPWQKDANGDCTTCGLSASSCNANEQFDLTNCKCICSNLHCDINVGQVVDETQQCACRTCKAGECKCGNGIVEAGEQCEDKVGDQCCKNCTFVTDSCDDGNACTMGDVCNGTFSGEGSCRGDFSCLPSDECNDRSCNTTTGCISIPKADGTACGSHALCYQQCVSGLCTVVDIHCAADNDTTDCFVPVCNNATGSCSYVPTTGTPCNDGDSCTTDDQCRQGVCQGKFLDCGTSSNVCVNRTCVAGTCFDVPYANGLPCNYDNNSCTVGDYCVVGQCYPGPLKACNGTTVCNYGACNPTTGECFLSSVTDNRTCDDHNNCTKDDRCYNGTCAGDVDENAAANVAACGALPLTTPSSVNNNSIVIFSVAGAAALIGAVAGLAFLLKRIRDKKLLDAETWNPDTFSSLQANPLYKGSSNMVDNQLYEGSM